MYKFCHITDQHLSDRPVGNRVPTYPEEMLAKMTEIIDVCVEQRRDLIQTGDLFDSKRPNHVSHRLVQNLIAQYTRMVEEGLRVYTIPGNHDLSEEGVHSLPKQPLGVLGECGAVDLLLYEPEFVEVDDLTIQLTPFAYDEEGEDSPGFFKSKRSRNADVHILLTHGAIAPDSAQLPYPHINYSQFPKKGVDMVLCGHLHHDYGVEDVNGTKFVQLGSLARRSRTQKRDVYAALVDIHRDGTATVDRYKLKCAQPWDSIFLESDTMPEYLLDPAVTEFARDVRDSMSLDDLDLNVVLAELREQMGAGVFDKVIHYLSEAGHEPEGQLARTQAAA